MKKKSISLLIILVLSIIVNINRVNAAITANGEQWEKECKYNGNNGQFSLYIKSGKSLIIRQTPAHPEDTLIIYNGKNEQKFDKFPNRRDYITTNNIVINDGKCPIKISEWTITTGGFSGTPTTTRIEYSLKESGNYVYYLEGGSSSSSSKDNNGYTKCDEVINQTVRKLINKYLGYIHIIVPMLIIALGTYDFFRAMIASKEDEMKKAQKRFIIRLVAGALVFLAPTIVNIIIDILNSVLVGTENKACGLLTAVQNNIYL